MVGDGGGARSLEHLGPAFAWLAQHPEVRDVIVSGGDPLVMSTERLVAALRAAARHPERRDHPPRDARAGHASRAHHAPSSCARCAAFIRSG